MSEPPKRKKTWIVVSILAFIGVAVLATGGFLLYRDEATGVCETPDGACEYATPNQCSGKWSATKDFYTWKQSCTTLGHASCDEHKCRK